ncbi:MAG: sulfotransferase family 2 domain-containing protein [Arhodomonas sp.]|nr:sulfotransferase family 2 domain-containing protein [Arhodomonas sp.]
MFFFVHIPKTAGTSFRHGLAKVPNVNLMLAYHSHRDRDERLLALTTREEGEALIRTLDPGKLHIIAGHVPYEQYATLTPPEQVLSLVRNPIERALSAYQHIAWATPGEVTDLRSFLQQENMSDRQTKMLRSLDLDRAQVGLNSHYAEYLDIVRHSPGLDVPPLTKNRTSGERTRSRGRLPADLIREAFTRNEQDVMLLYSVAERFEHRLRRLGFRTTPEGGSAFQLALDRDLHVNGRLKASPMDTGIVSLAVNGERRAITRLEVNGDKGIHRFQYPLALLGVGPGDTVAASLLNAPQTRGTLKVPQLRLQWLRLVSRLAS